MKKLSLWLYVLATLFFGFNVLSNGMNLNPLYPGSAFFYCFAITVYAAIYIFTRVGRLVVSEFNGAQQVNFVRSGKFPKWLIIFLAVIWAVYFIVTVGSSVYFNVNAYRNQMPDFTQGDFATEFETLDSKQLPIVDKSMAAKLADKKLGERPSLGSQVVLGTPTIQQVDGELVWAVPTYHSGFFKWLTNMEGTPGYVLVSATNPQDVEYVDGYYIKYQPGAYFFDNIKFHTRFTAAPFTGVTDYSFELDDTGKPFWVITTYKNTWGFALPEATGVIVMDCATGESQRYTIENVPSWVDRVQPEDFVMEQLNNKGEYVNGFLNFSDKDKYETSDGEMVVYNNGRCYLFTGLTSVGSDESAIGFVMIDMVTKEPILYRISGATEFSAQQSAQGKVQQYGYKASFPLIINYGGRPTYFMTLKDMEGLIKQFAYVSVEDYQSVGVGETVTEARQNYDKVLRQSPSSNIDNTTNTAESITANVVRIGSEFNGTQTIYHIVLEGKNDAVYLANAGVSLELALTQNGDSVTLEYYKSESSQIEVISFKNNAF